MFHLSTSTLLALVRQVKRGGVIINEHTLSADQTSRHVEILGRWFDFIHVDEISQRLTKPGRRPFCLLTFDDGKRSNFTEVAPELERRGVPAVFYVTTDFLTNGAPLWFDRRDALVRVLCYCPAELELHSLKRLSLVDLTRRLDKACAEQGPNLAGLALDDHVLPMSWDNARELNRRGFTIGAHGLTHAILTNESTERAFTEIEESLFRVTAELGVPCRTFAFPNGNHTPGLSRHARRCGATTVMATEPRWVDDRSSLQCLPRIQLFGEFSRARIELKIALASIPGALVNPNGSGRTSRTNVNQHQTVSQSGLSSCVE